MEVKGRKHRPRQLAYSLHRLRERIDGAETLVGGRTAWQLALQGKINRREKLSHQSGGNCVLLLLPTYALLLLCYAVAPVLGVKQTYNLSGPRMLAIYSFRNCTTTGKYRCTLRVSRTISRMQPACLCCLRVCYTTTITNPWVRSRSPTVLSIHLVYTVEEHKTRTLQNQIANHLPFMQLCGGICTRAYEPFQHTKPQYWPQSIPHCSFVPRLYGLDYCTISLECYTITQNLGNFQACRQWIQGSHSPAKYHR